MIAAFSAVSPVLADYETVNIFGGIGFGFGMGGTLYTSRNTETASTKEKDQFYNYGNGLKFDIGCQYFLMDKVSLQGSFCYSAGLPAFKVVTESANRTDTETFGRQLFGVKVHIVPKFEVLDLIDMYTGVGFGVYWNSRKFERVIETNVKQEANGSINSSPSLGFSGMLGTDYPIDDKLTLFGELGFEHVTFNLTEYVIDKSTIPGIQGGSTIKYVKDDSNIDNYSPAKIPGSNFQLRVGVRYALK